MADFDLSMVVSAETAGAVAGATSFSGALDGVARAEDGAASSASRLETETAGVGAAQARTTRTTAEQAAQMTANAAAINQVVRATNPAISTQALLDNALRGVQRSAISGAVSAETYARAQQIAARATQENVSWQNRLNVSQRQSSFGAMMFGQQIQDVGMQVALGTPILRVFAMQAGQTALAVQQMGGAASGVARFIGGPYGSLILAGVSILALFATRSNEATSAQQNLAEAADTLGRAQGLLGHLVDLATGKITSQNVVVREAIRLQAILAQIEAAAAGRAAGQRLGAMRPTYSRVNPDGSLTGGSPVYRWFGLDPNRVHDANTTQAPAAAAFQQLVQNYRQNPQASVVDFRHSLEALQARGGLRGVDVNAAVREALTVAINRQEIATMGDVRRVAEGGALPSYLRRGGGGGGRHPRERTGPDLAEIGRDTADRLSNITSRFTDQPKLIEQVQVALREVDNVMRDVERRKPPNIESLRVQADEARVAIQAAVDRPYRQFIEAQEQQIANQRLITQGRVAEAEAGQIIYRLEQQMGPLSEERKAAILAGVEALRAEERQLQVNQEKQQKYIQALNDIRSTIVDTIEGGFRNISDIPKRLLASFNHLQAEYIFENLFGDTFRRLTAQVRGEHTVEDAAGRFRQAVDTANAATARHATTTDHATTSMDHATTALDRFTTAVTGAATAAAGGPANAQDAANLAAWNGTSPPVDPNDSGDIVVTGTRIRRQTATEAPVSGIPTDPRGFFEHVTTQLAQSIFGARFAATLGGVVSKGLQGAAVGSAVAGIGKAVGIKTSNTGGQIGGAIGGFAATAVGLPPIVGQVVGAVLGSVIGGLFKKSKTGSVTLTSAYDPGATSGNNAASIKNATGLAGSVQDSLVQIAQQLGGTLGSFAVSIGQKDGKYRVDPTGKGNVKTKKGAVDFGDDEAAAVAYALADAIKDGAVTGLSAAVRQALGSSSDVNKALAEALKVQNLEDLIAGIGGKLARQFKTEDALAADRVRLAKTYGLDLLAVEKINAQERVDLVKSVTEERLGSAMQFLKDLKFGDLFEGDASTRRTAILDEISKTQKDAEAGVDGAADKLTDLYRQLISTSKDAFGTAGPELVTDRSTAQSGIEKVIQMENDRIAAASGLTQAQLDAIQAGNALTDETNSLIAVTNGKLDTLITTFTGGGTGGGGDMPAGDVTNLPAKVGRFTNLALA